MNTPVCQHRNASDTDTERTVLTRISNGIAHLTLNRPAVLNALDRQMIEDLRQATAAVEVDPAVRVILLSGAGEHFMAGGDLKWFRAQLALPPQERQPLFERLIADVHATVLQLRRCPQPVVVAVRGAVAGFGLSLMLAADLAIAAESAYFTLAYRHIGLSPDGGATWSLPRLVGLRQAMEIALLGERFDATRARELGLVNRVVASDQLDAAALALAEQLAAGPATALAQTKALINQSFERSLETQLHAEQRAFAASAVAPDFAEGLEAFFGKRAPQFNQAR